MKPQTPKNWWQRQRRRFRLSIIKLRRLERASELRVEADPLPETGDRERETSAFWFRRVTTTVLLGNGTGIIAIGSYVANGNLSPEVARLAYPAMSSFLTGALLGFGCYILSFFSTSMRFEAYTTVLEKASRIAKSEGKRFASTQHDGAFYFLLLLIMMQIVFLLFSSISFYNGASHILSALGKTACVEDRETYCYGSPILFPFVSPHDYKAAENPTDIERPPLSEFQVESISEEKGSDSEVVRLSVHIPAHGIITDIVPQTTVQITSKYGLSCTYKMQWFSIGGTYIRRTKEAELLQAELFLREYSITPVSARLYVDYKLLGDKIANEVINVDLSSGKAVKVNNYVAPAIDLYVFMFGGPLGYVIESDDISEVSDIRCLDLAERAGFALSERAENLVSNLRNQSPATPPPTSPPPPPPARR